MRMILSALLIAAALSLAACGGNDDSGGSSATAPGAAGEQAGGATGSAGSGSGEAGAGGDGAEGGGGSSKTGSRASARERERAERRSALRLRTRARRAADVGRFKGEDKTVYLEARSRCHAIPLAALATIYDSSSTTPEAVARAYAGKQAPTGSARRAAESGCLVGIDIRLRRGGR
jgi:hypothetical protein